MTEELQARLMGVKLTKKEKLIAEFILDNFAEACFITSTEIAKRLHVSDSSVIRFTRTLGYTGFMDFQRSIRKTYTERINSVSGAAQAEHRQAGAERHYGELFFQCHAEPEILRQPE